MYGVELDYALNCVLRMLEIFSRGREPEVEGDDSRVVVFKKVAQKMEEAGECSYPL